MSRLAGPATGADVADADLAAALAAAADEEFERAVREHHEVKKRRRRRPRVRAMGTSSDGSDAGSTVDAIRARQLPVRRASDLNEEAARSTNTPPRGTTIAEQLDEYMAEPAPAAGRR